MVTEEQRQWLWEVYAPDPRMRLNRGIRRRLAPLVDNDPRKILLANAILFSLPGAPIIYYGDEIGLGDNINLPDRMGVRTPMQWNDRHHAGFSGAAPDALYAPVIDDSLYGYRQLNVSAQQADPASLYNRMRQLIQVRKRHRAFSRGSIEFIEGGNPATTAFLRTYEDETIVIVHNLTDEGQEVTLDRSVFKRRLPVNVLDSLGEYSLGEIISSRQVTLSPYQSLWLQLARA
jgi:maltose alpha-D-glucosyltransferase/alpha-amylase